MRFEANVVLINNKELIERSVLKKKYTPIFFGGYLGCGEYGCVYETESKKIVFKVTSDLGETKFVIAAMNLGEWPEGMVQYYQFLALKDIEILERKYNMFGLWRERADNVGDLSETEVEPIFLDHLGGCYDIAKEVRKTLENKDVVSVYGKSLNNWVKEQQQNYIEWTKKDVGEFNPILHAMGWYAKRGILLGDVHLGNLGQVKRKENGNKYIWVITDPGEAVFIDDRYNKLFIEYGL